MTLKTRESLTPLPGQLVFPFMLAEVERPERGSQRGRANETPRGNRPAGGTTTSKVGTRDG